MSIVQALDAWITSQGIRFSMDSVESFHKAVDEFAASLDDKVKIVALGEALHDGEGFLMLRNYMFQRLVEAHGFTAIAIESSFPKAHSVNEYVKGKGPDSYEAIKNEGFSHGLGHLEANRELVEWMRKYNADPSHSTKLRFYGIDSPTEMTRADSPRQLLRFVLDYLDLIADEGVKDRRGLMETLIGLDSEWEEPAAMLDASKSIGLSDSANSLRIATEDLITELEIRRPRLIELTDREQYLEAFQHASVARLQLNYHAEMARESDNRVSNLLGIRDTIIADNLLYAVASEAGRGKILLFAHNQHLKRSKVHWQLGNNRVVWYPAGAHLSALLGPQYVIIGAGLGTSEDYGIGVPEQNTLESLLTRRLESAMFIPTNKAQSISIAERSTIPTRAGSSKNASYFPLTSESLFDFDWLYILKFTGASRRDA